MRSPHVGLRVTGAGGAHWFCDVLRSAWSRLAIAPAALAEARLRIRAASPNSGLIGGASLGRRRGSGLRVERGCSRRGLHARQTRTTKSDCQASRAKIAKVIAILPLPMEKFAQMPTS